MKTPEEIFKELSADLPYFIDGRINYTGAKKAPVINIIVYFEGEIFLAKRSEKVAAYAGLWNCVSGYIDEEKSIEEFAQQELKEEIGVEGDAIDKIVIGEPYEVVDKDIDRIWYVFPVLAVLTKKPEAKLDWEHTESVWIKPENLSDYNYVKDLDKSVESALKLL